MEERGKSWGRGEGAPENGSRRNLSSGLIDPVPGTRVVSVAAPRSHRIGFQAVGVFHSCFPRRLADSAWADEDARYPAVALR